MALRVISGSLKGQQLLGPKKTNPLLRPMTDYVKESIFNKWHDSWENSRVLDLFSGTGNLAIEAFSRGASYVEAVENTKSSIHLIYKNLNRLHLQNKIHVVFQDVFKYLKGYNKQAFDVVLIDPPFKKKMAHQVMLSLSKSSVAISGSLIVIESYSREKMEESYANLSLLDKKKWSDKSLSFFIKNSHQQSTGLP